MGGGVGVGVRGGGRERRKGHCGRGRRKKKGARKKEDRMARKGDSEFSGPGRDAVRQVPIPRDCPPRTRGTEGLKQRSDLSRNEEPG